MTDSYDLRPKAHAILGEIRRQRRLTERPDSRKPPADADSRARAPAAVDLDLPAVTGCSQWLRGALEEAEAALGPQLLLQRTFAPDRLRGALRAVGESVEQTTRDVGYEDKPARVDGFAEMLALAEEEVGALERRLAVSRDMYAHLGAGDEQRRFLARIRARAEGVRDSTELVEAWTEAWLRHGQRPVDGMTAFLAVITIVGMFTLPGMKCDMENERRAIYDDCEGLRGRLAALWREAEASPAEPPPGDPFAPFVARLRLAAACDLGSRVAAVYGWRAACAAGAAWWTLGGPAAALGAALPAWSPYAAAAAGLVAAGRELDLRPENVGPRLEKAGDRLREGAARLGDGVFRATGAAYDAVPLPDFLKIALITATVGIGLTDRGYDGLGRPFASALRGLAQRVPLPKLPLPALPELPRLALEAPSGWGRLALAAAPAVAVALKASGAADGVAEGVPELLARVRAVEKAAADTKARRREAERERRRGGGGGGANSKRGAGGRRLFVAMPPSARPPHCDSLCSVM